MKVLLLEDNVQIAQNIVRFLWLKNIFCEAVLDGKQWYEKAMNHFYDVIILDINLPNMSGNEILKSLREKHKDTQILMLTSYSTKTDIIDYLNLWADDYMTKPFDLEELFARIQALNRRNLKNKSNIISFWEYVLDIEKVELCRNGEKIKLSSLEFQLLKYFFQNPWKTLSRQELYEKVWGEFDGDIMFSKTVDVYIGYVRKKTQPTLIETIKGLWYRLWEI